MEGARSVEPMTPNTTAENTGYERSPSVSMSMSPSGMKRKSGDGAQSSTEDKENGGVEKKAKTYASSSSTPLVELKGRKVIFKQDPLTRNYPRRRLLNFEGYLLDEADAKRPITEIPEEHWELIVMAGHEHESLLAKNIRTALSSKSDEAILPIKAIESLIPKLFTLQQYGYVPADFTPSTSSVSKLPAGLQIRSWEANDVQRYFPAEQHEALEVRRLERARARQECLRILEELDDVERLELVRGDKSEKADRPGKVSKAIKSQEDGKTVESVLDSPRVQETRQSREGTANTVDSRRSASPTKKSKMTPEEEEAARLRREEKEAKRAAIAEKKAAKEREEKKREAAKAKQIQTMNAFFKPKTAPSPSVSRASPAGPSTVKRESAPAEVSDYARTFRPMAHRPHVHVAEYNRWHDSRRSCGKSGDGDVFGGAQSKLGSSSVKKWQSLDCLAEHLQKHGRRIKNARTHLPKGIKSMPIHGTVADIWSSVQDAEDPREVLDQLRDRTKFPWKTLAFDQQTRPPYCGTFTKKSVVVGPRTPFAQDPIFDYSYDSGDDWQDDEGGEDVDDFGEAQPVEEEDTEDEEDGEFDDWLDDAEEDVEFTPADGESEAASVPGAGLDQQRLPMKVVKKSREVPKKVVKVVPYWKGPIWEKNIGEVGNDGLEAYRIQLLNETPPSIDPFTFTSADTLQQYKASFSTTVIGSSLDVRCLLSTEVVTVKADPNPTSATATSTSTSSADQQGGNVASDTQAATSSTPTPDGATTNRSRATGPKIGFPTSHLAELLQSIEGSTKIRTDLVSILRDKFESVTSKAAIEAKIKEVAVREGKSKDSPWRVKSEAWLAAGLTPPPPPPVPPTKTPFDQLAATAPTSPAAPAPPPAPASASAPAPPPPSSSSEPIIVD